MSLKRKHGEDSMTGAIDFSPLRQQALDEWKTLGEAADEMVPLIGSFYRQNNVGVVALICVHIHSSNALNIYSSQIIFTLFGRGLVHCSSIEIIQRISYVQKHFGIHDIQPSECLHLLRALAHVQGSLAGLRIDLGRTCCLLNATSNLVPQARWHTRPTPELGLYLQRLIQEQTLASPSNDRMKPNSGSKPRDVILYGFGRIGRLVARLLIEKSGAGVKLMLRAIVVRPGSKGDLMKRASLLRRDSVHGAFRGTIAFNETANAFIANGNLIQVIYASRPEEVDYSQYAIENAVVIDNTGKWRDEAGLRQHLKARGVSKVILTAPASGSNINIETIVAGVNDSHVGPDSSQELYSAASCTTNAITPILAAMDARFGIRSGHIETVHSFTNDQNLIDNYHTKERRGRSAVLNMVLTETGRLRVVGFHVPRIMFGICLNMFESYDVNI